MGSAMQSLYSANPPKSPGQQNQPSWTGGSQQVQRPPTFSNMQQSGQPRPAPPPSWYNYQPGSASQGTQPPPRPPQPSYGTQPPQSGGGFQRPPWAQGNYQTDQGYTPPPGPYAPQQQPPSYGAPPYSQGPQTGYTQPQPPQSW